MKSAGLILAAGSSRRMGRPKQLLLVDGQPLLAVVTARVCAADLEDVVVVLGGNAAEIQRAVDLGRARVVLNPDHAGGLSTSLRAGIGALDGDVQRAVIVLGDQPDVSTQVIDALLDLHQTSGLAAAALNIDGLLHPPVVLDRGLWPELATLEGDVGCRAVVRGRPEQVAALHYAGRTGHPIDLDTPDDYRRWQLAEGTQ